MDQNSLFLQLLLIGNNYHHSPIIITIAIISFLWKNYWLFLIFIFFNKIIN